jgi:hypothetical protein
MSFIDDICDEISSMLHRSARNRRVFFDEEMSADELAGLPSGCSRYLNCELLAFNNSAFLLSYEYLTDGKVHFFFVVLDDEIELKDFPTVPKFDIFHSTDYGEISQRFAKYSGV